MNRQEKYDSLNPEEQKEQIKKWKRKDRTINNIIFFSVIILVQYDRNSIITTIVVGVITYIILYSIWESRNSGDKNPMGWS